MRHLALIAVAVVLVSISRGEAHAQVVGVMTDVGVPDGATASIAVRPIYAVRLEAGVSTNGVGPGYRGGITLIPMKSWCTPVLGGGGGHFDERDANPFIREITGNASFSSPVLEHFGYNYMTARAGLEFGRKRFTFFIHGGITRVWGQIHDLQQAASSSAGSDMVTVASNGDPHVKLTSVSANIGFVLYLF